MTNPVSSSTQANLPNINAPIAELNSGATTPAWYRFFVAIFNIISVQGNGNTLVSGQVITFAGAVLPTGFLACDGSAVSRNTYAGLFNAIGTTWGDGDGASTFNVPDFRDRFLVGAGLTYTVGHTGGSPTATLTTANLASHNHGVTDPGHTHVFTGTPHGHAITDPGHVHTTATPDSNGTNGSDPVGESAGDTGSATTGITINNTAAAGTNATSPTGISTQNAGTATPFSILPPYGAVQTIIKT